MSEINKYKIKNFSLGLYEFDTLFVDVNGEIYQIPCKKGISNKDIIDKEVIISDLFTPLEDVKFATLVKTK